MNWLTSWFSKSEPQRIGEWHRVDLHFPKKLTAGGNAYRVAWRRWNGEQWEYKEHSQDFEAYREDQW